MAETVFFSWQLDTPGAIGRNFILQALEDAVSQIRAGADIEEALRDVAVDRDTQGVPGSPPIAETIFSKIDQASVYVADLTFVANRFDGRPSPNPNVLIEYGWALKSLGHSRVLLVMNTEYGGPTRESMPFNLGHVRFPIQYACKDNDAPDVKRQAKKMLTKAFVQALNPILLAPRTSEHAIPRTQFVSQAHGASPGRFRLAGEPLGVVAPIFGRGQSSQVYLADGPVAWLRVMPAFDPQRKWRTFEIEKIVKGQQNDFLPPFGGRGTDFDYVRGADGLGSFRIGDVAKKETNEVSYVFTTGEAWGIDADVMNPLHMSPPIIPDLFDMYGSGFRHFIEALKKMQVPEPMKWEAGLEGVRGRSIFTPARHGSYSAFPFAGHCMLDNVSATGEYSPSRSYLANLRPFFETLYDACGVSLPEWRLEL